MEGIVEISNFGKVKSAKIRLRDLTVFAGTNNTGKSYVSRAMYSILSALRVEPQEKYYAATLGGFADYLIRVNDSFVTARAGPSEFSAASRVLGRFIRNAIDAENRAIKLETLKSLLAERERLVQETREELAASQKDTKLEDSFIASRVEHIMAAFGELAERINLSPAEAIKEGYRQQMFSNLQDDFQVGRLTKLIGPGKQNKASLAIKLNGTSKIAVEIEPADGSLTADIDVLSPQALSDVIYFESPTYWKLRQIFSGNHPRRQFRGRRSYLSGVPRYIQDAANSVLLESADKPEGNEVMDGLAEDIEASIGGRIVLDSIRSELVFVEYKGPAVPNKQADEFDAEEGISLLLTATGVVQLGVLAFFIRNRIIGDGTSLFYDEPEAHLHPAWQEKIMDALYALAKLGVNVVMATHSSTTLQKLELLLKKDNSPPAVGWNYFNDEGDFDSVKQEAEKIKDDIAESLERPSYDIYLRNFG